MARRAKRRRRHGALAIGAAGVLAAAAAAALVLGGGAGDPPVTPALPVGANALAAVDAGSGRLVGRVGLPARPDDAVAAGDSVWVLSDGRRRVVRVDARSRRVAASVALPFPPGGMAPGRAGLWVAEAAGPRVALIGARSGRVERTLRVRPGAGHAGPLAVGYGSLWLGRGPEVLRVQPRSGRVLARLSTPVDVTILRAADDAVWTVSSKEGRVAKIDPATTRVVARSQLRGWVSDLAVGGGFAWLGVVPDDTVFKLSADDLAVIGAGRVADGPDRLSWGDGRLWISTGVRQTLVREGGGPAVRLDAIPAALSASGGLLWTATLPVPPPARPPGRGGELRVAVQDDGVATDPAFAFSPDAAQLHYATCAALMTYPDAAGAAGRRLVPEVAAAPPDVSADGRTYTFQIRAGFRFSPPSGAPVTAETFRSSIERALSPRLGEEAPALSVLGDVVGAAAYHAGRAPHVRGVTVEGDRLRIRLMRPAGDLPARLALPSFCPAPDGTPAVPGGSTSPLPSAGPYYVASEDVGRTVLERNPNYGGERPRRLDRIVFLTGVGAEEALERADRGEVDYVPYDYDHRGPLAVGGPRDRQFGAGSAAARRGDQRYFATPAPGVDMIAFNTRRPLFRDPAMRRAVNEAIDRPALAAVWSELPTDRYVPSAILPAAVGERYPVAAPDLRTARRLAAGRHGTATLYYCGEAGNRRVAEIVRANLRPIGIRVRITPSLACLRGPDPARDRADLVLVSPASLVPDPARFVAFAGGDDAQFGGQALPRGAWQDPSFSRRLARADRLTGAAREESLAALEEEALREHAPLAAFGNFVRPEYVAPRVGCRIVQGALQFLDLGAACVVAPS